MSHQGQPLGIYSPETGLSAEDKWKVFTEASVKGARIAEALRRGGIDSSQHARIVLR
ncbi:hypothetical protein BH24ACT26_BH24ACT26_08970 [soil metagenome]